MSVQVEVAQLADALADYPWGYFITVSHDGRAHMLAVPTQWGDGGVMVLTAGQRTMANLAQRPNVSMLFPPVAVGGMSLIVDGTAEVIGDHVAVRPTSAVLHRPAIH